MVEKAVYDRIKILIYVFEIGKTIPTEKMEVNKTKWDNKLSKPSIKTGTAGSIFECAYIDIGISSWPSKKSFQKFCTHVLLKLASSLTIKCCFTHSWAQVNHCPNWQTPLLSSYNQTSKQTKFFGIFVVLFSKGSLNRRVNCVDKETGRR